MKLLLSFLLLFSVNSSIYAQDTLITYLNKKWKKTDKDHASYYRKTVMVSKNNWSVQDFHMNGKLQMSGYYLSKKAKKKNGHFVYYYPSGAKKSEWKIVNNVPTGKYKSWYVDGGLKESGEYSHNGKTKLWRYWKPNGKVDREGFYMDDMMNGEWKWFFDNGLVSSIEFYKDDKMINFHHFGLEGKELINDTVYQVYPKYVGGKKARVIFLKNNVNYPQRMIDKGISGTVIVSFVIEKDGSISGARVSKSVHTELDNEALRVINRMPNWIPGKSHNRPVRVGFNMPVRFILRR